MIRGYAIRRRSEGGDICWLIAHTPYVMWGERKARYLFSSEDHAGAEWWHAKFGTSGKSCVFELVTVCVPRPRPIKPTPEPASTIWERVLDS